MCTRTPHPLLPRWLTSALLVVALLVAGQAVHLPAAHHDGMQPAGEAMTVAMEHGGDHRHAVADCSDSLCNLCLTPASAATESLPRATVHLRSSIAGEILATPLERLYRPPIDLA